MMFSKFSFPRPNRLFKTSGGWGRAQKLPACFPSEKPKRKYGSRLLGGGVLSEPPQTVKVADCVWWLPKAKTAFHIQDMLCGKKLTHQRVTVT